MATKIILPTPTQASITTRQQNCIFSYNVIKLNVESLRFRNVVGPKDLKAKTLENVVS